MKGAYLGELEELILLSVAVLYDRAYGVTIVEELDQRIGRKISLGAVYTVLMRLEDKERLPCEGVRDAKDFIGSPVREKRHYASLKISGSVSGVLFPRPLSPATHYEATATFSYTAAIGSMVTTSLYPPRNY